MAFGIVCFGVFMFKGHKVLTNSGIVIFHIMRMDYYSSRLLLQELGHKAKLS